MFSIFSNCLLACRWCFVVAASLTSSEMNSATKSVGASFVLPFAIIVFSWCNGSIQFSTAYVVAYDAAVLGSASALVFSFYGVDICNRSVVILLHFSASQNCLLLKPVIVCNAKMVSATDAAFKVVKNGYTTSN